MRPLTWILLLILAVVAVAFFMSRRSAAAPAAQPSAPNSVKTTKVDDVKSWLTVPGSAVSAIKDIKSLFQ